MKNTLVVSDFHLGAWGSEKLVRATASRLACEVLSLGEVENVILLGDFLDLAFSGIRKVMRYLLVFCDGLSGLIEAADSVIYVPGNHDHHIWTLHVEPSIAAAFRDKDILYLGLKWRGFYTGAESFLSTYFAGADFSLWYPHHSFRLPNGVTCLFHHGHQIYGVGVRMLSLKEAMKELSPMRACAGIERGNIAVYELLWYYLERDPDMRQRIRETYEKKGGFACFAMVAEEMADSRFVWLLRRITSLLYGKRKERGRTILDNKDAIMDYMALCGNAEQCLVYGHSHVPQLVYGAEVGIDSLRVIANPGSWLPDRPLHNTYLMINEDGAQLRVLGTPGPLRWIKW